MRAPTRRELIRGAVGGIPAVLLAGESVALAAGAESETARLTALLALEQLAVALYARALSSTVLTPAARSLFGEIHTQELAHAAALEAELDLLSPTALKPPRRPRTAAEIDAELAAAGIDAELAHQRDQLDWLRVLEHLENALEGAYYKALLRLEAGDAASLAARILANEAQHNALLTEVRHPGKVALAVPVALVEGDARPS
jgi:rubrerythrin